MDNGEVLRRCGGYIMDGYITSLCAGLWRYCDCFVDDNVV